MIRWLFLLALSATLVIVPLPSHAAADLAGHPRLFFHADQLDALRAEAKTTHQEIWSAILSYVDTQVGAVPPMEIPNGLTEEQIRPYGDDLIAFAFSCVITEQPQYCGLARDTLVAYAHWSRWGEGNLRDLALAHMLIGSSIAYDWVYDTLSDDDRKTVAAALTRYGQQMYEASSGPYNDAWTNWWAGSYVQNHFSTNNSALGIVGLALAGDTQADTQAWIKQATDAVSRMTYLLSGIQDGSWHESIDYQTYMLTMLLPFLVNLRSLQGIDLLPNDYLRNFVNWRIYNYLPGRHEYILDYGDYETWWGNSFEAQSILRFAAHEYGDPRAEWMAEQIIGVSGRAAGESNVPWQVFEYLYYDPSIPAKDPTDLPLAKQFSDAGAVVWRTGWGTNDLVFGLQGGSYGGDFPLRTFVDHLYPWGTACQSVGCTYNVGHDHADGNTFSIYNHGQWLTTEWVAYGERDTSAHNTIQIDGQNQFLPVNPDYANPDSFAGTEGSFTSANGHGLSYAASDVTGRYKVPDLHAATRYVVFVKPDYFLMLDNLAADSPHDYYWISHFSKGVTIENNWVRGDAENDQVLGIGIAAPQPFDAITSADAFPYVRIAPGSKDTSARFINLLYPTDSANWDKRPDVSLIEDTGRAALTEVRAQDGRRDEIIIEYSGATTAYTVGGYSTDAKVAILKRDAQGNLASLYLVGGSFLSDNKSGVALVNNASRDGTFEAEFSGDSVHIYGGLPQPVTLYAPQTTKVVINSAPRTLTRQGDFITAGD